MIPQLNSGEKCEKQLLADAELPSSSPVPVTTESRAKFLRDVNVVVAIEMIGCAVASIALTVELFRNIDKNPFQNLFRDWVSPSSYEGGNSICFLWPFSSPDNPETSLSSEGNDAPDDLSSYAGVRYNLWCLAAVFLTYSVLTGKLYLADYLRKQAASNSSMTIEEINRRPFYWCIGLQFAITYLPTFLILPLLCATNSYPFAAFITHFLLPISCYILIGMTIIIFRFILCKSYNSSKPRRVVPTPTSSDDLLTGFRTLIGWHLGSLNLILFVLIVRKVMSDSSEYKTVNIWDPLICKENSFWESCDLKVQDGDWSESALSVFGAYLLFLVLKIVVGAYLLKWVAKKKTSAEITGGHLLAFTSIFIGSGIGSCLTIHYFGLLNLYELDIVQVWEWIEAVFRLSPILFIAFCLRDRNSERHSHPEGLTTEAELESCPSPVDGVFTISNSEGVVKV